MAFQTRRATADDVDALLRNVHEGFATFTTFAPPGWAPPRDPGERERIVEQLSEPRTWALLVLCGGEPVGHVAFLPARRRSPADAGGEWRSRPLVPGLAHLWQLFVRPPWWGTGAAALAHEAAVSEMRGQGYTDARLYTPSGNVRARRFYERRGWRAVAESGNEGLRLLLTEYRLDLGPARRSS